MARGLLPNTPPGQARKSLVFEKRKAVPAPLVAFYISLVRHCLRDARYRAQYSQPRYASDLRPPFEEQRTSARRRKELVSIEPTVDLFLAVIIRFRFVPCCSQ